MLKFIQIQQKYCSLNIKIQNEHIRKQGQHRQNLEKTVVNYKQNNARLGQIFIFIICVLAVLISGIDIVYNEGHSAKYIMGCLFGFGVLSIISGQAIDKVERNKRLDEEKEYKLSYL